MTQEEKLARYPSTEMFSIIGTIPTTHPYCITSRHVAYTADHHSGMLDEYAIEQCEKHGITCGVNGCTMKFHDHKFALLVEVRSDKELKELAEPHGELHKFLLECKPLCEADGYEGFAFVQAKPTKK